jgi:hypothetical protein
LDPGPFVAEIITIIGYVMIFVGVYKLFQIGSDLGEIKELLKSQRGFAMPSGPAPSDPADAYAENLLRAINQESHHSVQDPEHAAAPPTRD